MSIRGALAQPSTLTMISSSATRIARCRLVRSDVRLTGSSLPSQGVSSLPRAGESSSWTLSCSAAVGMCAPSCWSGVFVPDGVPLTRSSAPQVSGPTMQSVLSPFLLWKAITACAVVASKVPVTGTPSIVCSSTTCGSVLPRLSIGRALEPLNVGVATPPVKRASLRDTAALPAERCSASTVAIAGAMRCTAGVATCGSCVTGSARVCTAADPLRDALARSSLR